MAAMKSTGSVTHLIEQLRSADKTERDRAAGQVWQRYFPQLLDLARRHLDQRVRRREDEEDVLQTMYKSLCRRLEQGKFQLDGRSDLWRLMVKMTLFKSRTVATRHGREARDYRREQLAPAAPADDSLPPAWDLEAMEGAGPTPAEAAVLAEEFQLRLQILPDNLRQIALWRLEDESNQAIAQKLNCTERSVERKLNRIRKMWTEEQT
jgi:RNA polymerase sigma factor (sigma-70 family)